MTDLLPGPRLATLPIPELPTDQITPSHITDRNGLHFHLQTLAGPFRSVRLAARPGKEVSSL